MAISIEPQADTGLLSVTGDVNVTLEIPAGASEDRKAEPYYIGLSDGSLIRASRDAVPDYEVVIEGAAIISVDGTTRALRVEWPIEWVSLAGVSRATAVTQKSEEALPLFRNRPSVVGDEDVQRAA